MGQEQKMKILRGREERTSWVLRRREERKMKAVEKQQHENAEDWREVRMEGKGKDAQSVKREMEMKEKMGCAKPERREELRASLTEVLSPAATPLKDPKGAEAGLEAGRGKKMKMDPSGDTGGDGEHREEDLKERGEEGVRGHWVSLAPEVKIRERHAEEACRVLRQQLPVAVEEYVSEQLEGKRKREGEDDWPAPRRGDNYSR